MRVCIEVQAFFSRPAGSARSAAAPPADAPGDSSGCHGRNKELQQRHRGRDKASANAAYNRC